MQSPSNSPSNHLASCSACILNTFIEPAAAPEALPTIDAELLANPFTSVKLDSPYRLAALPSPFTIEWDDGGGDVVDDATERYDSPEVKLGNELAEADRFGAEGPMTTNINEHFRARMTMVPFSNCIAILVTSGSGPCPSSSSSP